MLVDQLASTSPTQKEIEASISKPLAGLDTGPNRFQSQDKQKAVEENMAKVAPKKDDAKSDSPSTGSSSPAIDPFSKPGGTGNYGGIGANNGYANMNNGVQIGTQINGDVKNGTEVWTEQPNVTTAPEVILPEPPPRAELPDLF